MATIPLNDDWRIQSDAHCWMVQRRKWKKPTGATEKTWVWQAQTYHPTLEGAAASYVQCQARQSEVTGLSELIATLARVEAEVRSAFASVGGVTQETTP